MIYAQVTYNIFRQSVHKVRVNGPIPECKAYFLAYVFRNVSFKIRNEYIQARNIFNKNKRD